MTLTYLAHCKPCGGETPHRLVASTHGLLDDECTVCGHNHGDPDFGPPQEADPDAARDALLDWKEAY